MADGAQTDARTAPVAVGRMLDGLSGDALKAWRMADVAGRPSAAERNLPDEYPLGWYAVCYSDELAPAEVRPARYFGRDLVVWRGQDGVARVLDAYCAHYGANMAYGGRVVDDDLECPFHAWRYDGAGAVIAIPYAPNIPPPARRPDCVRHWETREANGFVWIWHHPARAAPMWEPTVAPEIGDPAWTPFRKYEWRVFTALENMADNGVDISHFKYVHGAMTVPDYEFEFEGVTRTVIARLKLGTPRGEVDGRIDATTHGPGQSFVRFSGLAETLLISGVTPVERDELHVRFAFTQPSAQTEGPLAGLASALLKDLTKQLDQDKLILDRHRRMDPPLSCDGDGPFFANKQYYEQFLISRAACSR